MRAHAKINLALVVGPCRPDGMHEIATVFQRIDLADEIVVAAAPELTVEGFEEDTLVRGALTALAEEAGVKPGWRAVIDKQIPVASGLGGGSSDAAAALALGNQTLAEPLSPERLHEVASRLGADVPFFLREGPQLGTGIGADLDPVDLPHDFAVVLVLPAGANKRSTAAVYDAFTGEAGFEDRRAALLAALEAGDLNGLPPNDLASSPVADELRAAGAFRADVSGAGPIVYGLYDDREQAAEAREQMGAHGATWLAQPAW
jgi:4-diphosphocytidyl-2-C-methyl-D-erythritol kinase